MEIDISQANGRVPVTVIQLTGTLDTSNFHELIAAARQLHEAGVRDLLLDLAGLTYISSAGLAALHMLTKMFRGESVSTGGAWGKHKQLDREIGLQEHVKLFKPSPEVDEVLDTTGFKQFFEVYTDMDTALQSYGSAVGEDAA
ncbi:MAG: STAS domain-containing protein [Chloroflexota bacterium]